MSTLSEKIKILLNNNEMTQKKLAEELHVSESAVQKWVVGRNAPSIFSVKEMSQIFCVPVQNIIMDDIEIPVYVQIDEYLPYSIALRCKENHDSVHRIFDAKLAKGAFLHRFINSVGDKCSAIYLYRREYWWHYREHEARMIRDWNEEYGNDR
jgi:DNA-binding XRE family transcriptional regulator